MCRPICSIPGASNYRGNLAVILLKLKARKISFADHIHYSRRIFAKFYTNHGSMTAGRVSVWLPCSVKRTFRQLIKKVRTNENLRNFGSNPKPDRQPWVTNYGKHGIMSFWFHYYSRSKSRMTNGVQRRFPVFKLVESIWLSNVPWWQIICYKYCTMPQSWFFAYLNGIFCCWNYAFSIINTGNQGHVLYRTFSA